jgi:hypothetical protein
MAERVVSALQLQDDADFLKPRGKSLIGWILSGFSALLPLSRKPGCRLKTPHERDECERQSFTLLRSLCSVRVQVRFTVHGSTFAVRRFVWSLHGPVIVT